LFLSSFLSLQSDGMSFLIHPCLSEPFASAVFTSVIHFFGSRTVGSHLVTVCSTRCRATRHYRPVP
jgi:hypothetical protein